MAFEFIAIHLFALIVNTTARPSTSPHPQPNGTVTADPDGSRVWCEPTHWYDILWFFFANFVLHALSVRSLPGENAIASTAYKICSLLVPYTGVRRGLCLILRASNFAGNDLQSAARANALCMVIRSPEWRPRDGQVIEGCKVVPPEEKKKKRRKSHWWKLSCSSCEQSEQNGVHEITTLDSKSSEDAKLPLPGPTDEVTLKTTDPYSCPTPRNLIDTLTRVLIETQRFQSRSPTSNIVDHANVKIHGVCQLAPGYALSYVPEDIRIYSHIKQYRTVSISRLLGLNHTPEIKLASTHDVPRILFSIIQTVSGAYAMYRARGSQIDQYGYAAFGLTVLPYMMVSIINFIGSLLSSEYETVYLVHSSILDEMKTRGGLCDGVVGSLERPSHQQFVYVDGETDVKPQGSKMRFTHSPGELHCHEVAEGLSKAELQVSERNHPLPPKDVWLADSWARQWREKRQKKKNETKCGMQTRSNSLLCVPSHSGFTRMSPLWYQSSLNVLTLVLLILALGLPYVIITILSGWHFGSKSTPTQRTFTLNWLICGQLQGYAVSYIEAVNGKGRVMKSFVIIFISYGCYCTMGLTAVAQEMIEFGTCKAL
ncbi:MAG: hypothetical protein LQ352_005670 [Teloschistes flavicans]|nr:MAG: hypothetical protein LQ352_005670 [Teloschistes flavicans]